MVDPEKLAALAAQHDSSDMAAIIAQSPEQIGYALTDPDLPRPAGGPYQRAVIAGMGGSAFPADVLADAFEGRQGVRLVAVNAADGKTISTVSLKDMPVFDGMAAAAGRLFISTQDNTIVCRGQDGEGQAPGQ